MVRNFFLVVVLFTSVSHADKPDADLLWKARGLQAVERLAVLNPKKRLTPDEECQKVMELAFGLFSQPEVSDAIISKGIGGRNFYWTQLSGKDDKKLTSVAFTYMDGESAPSGYKIEHLADGWTYANFKRNGEWLELIATEKCVFTIDKQNPLAMIASPIPATKK